MEKKKQATKKDKLKEDNMNALDDMHVYRAGNEADETLNKEDEYDIEAPPNSGNTGNENEEATGKDEDKKE